MADSNMPDMKKILRGRYDAALVIYQGSTGETIAWFDKGIGIRFFIKEDNPYALNIGDAGIKSILFPILKVGISIEQDKWLRMQDHKNDLVARFAIQSKDMAVDPTGTGNQIVMEETPIFDLRFEVLLTDTEDHASKTSDQLQRDEKSTDPYTLASPELGTRYKTAVLILSCIDHRNRFKFPINYCHGSLGSQDATVEKALTLAICTACKEAKSVVMQLPDNKEQYTQVVMPPYNLKDMITYLQTVYGIYKTGLLIYQDLTYLYILPKVSTKYAIPDEEYSKVDIYVYGNEVNQSAGNSTGYYKDASQERYVISCGPSFKLYDASEYTKESQGNKFTVFNPEKSEKAVTYIGESWGGNEFIDEYETQLKPSNKGSADKIRIFENAVSNDYLMKARTAGIDNTTVFLHMAINHVPFTVFTFNRIYTLYFKEDLSLDAKFGGKYRLLKASCTGISEQAENMNLSADLTFAKINEESL